MSLAKIEDIERFEVKQTLPVITCDYESLKNWAQGITAKYKGLLVTENQIPEIKKDMAELNKIKAKIERARIDAVKSISAPIKEFEAQIKSVVGIFEDTYTELGNQIKDYENAAREEKRGKIQEIIDEQVALAIAKNLDMRDIISISVNEKWLNKSASLKTIGEEITQSIKAQIAAELEKRRREKAQDERRLLIENAVNAAIDKYAISMSISQFMTAQFINLEVDAADVLQAIEDAAQVKKKLLEREIARDAQNDTDYIEKTPENPILAPNQGKNEDSASDLMIFCFTALYSQDQEEQVREILNNNQFMRIKRQLESIGVNTHIQKGKADDIDTL